MQETLLRRDRSDHARPGNKDGLTHLLIPWPEGHWIAEIGTQLETFAAHVVDERLALDRLGPAGRLPDRANRHPGCEVSRRHPAIGQLFEAAMQLHRSPGFVRRVLTGRE